MQETPVRLPHDHGHQGAALPHMPDADTLATVSAAMKQLGDATRLHIFWFLCHYEECVINIAAYMQMSSPAISHHLRLLKPRRRSSRNCTTQLNESGASHARDKKKQAQGKRACLAPVFHKK